MNYIYKITCSELKPVDGVDFSKDNTTFSVSGNQEELRKKLAEVVHDHLLSSYSGKISAFFGMSTDKSKNYLWEKFTPGYLKGKKAEYKQI